MMTKLSKTKLTNETPALRRLGKFVLAALSANKTTAGALALLLLASQASAASFIFSTGDPDGKIATLSRPSSPGKLQTETADDFVAAQAVVISQATFTGLLPLGTDLTSVGSVEIEIYHVFPGDSANPPSGNVLTRTNSPGDVEIDSATRDSADGSLSFSATVVNPSFSASNSVVRIRFADGAGYQNGMGEIEPPSRGGLLKCEGLRSWRRKQEAHGQFESRGRHVGSAGCSLPAVWCHQTGEGGRHCRHWGGSGSFA